jgi:purple acid phosphatase-like protein
MKLIRSRRILFIEITLLLCLGYAAQVPPYTPNKIEPPARKTTTVRITEGPSLEMFRNNEAIIRWTSTNPGGTDEHWGVIRYGTSPGQLTETAKGHIRLNRGHSYTVFRVRVPDIKPGTTYYYTVNSMNADGAEDAVKSGIYHFTAPGGA